MKHYTLTLTALLVLSLAVPAAFGAEPPAARAAEIKIVHDWPGYTGPEGTFADQSRVKLLDDLSQAKLVWTSEHDDLGYGKTTSGGGHRYGAKSRPSGSCSLIVAGGMVIVTYFSPKNSVVADDVVLALDAATGKTRWKQVYAGKGLNRGAGKHPSYGPTPAAADGRVFHLGSAGRIYALELASGKPLWEADLGDYPQHFQALAAAVQPKDEIKEGMWSVRKSMRQTVNPLIVIDGVLMVPCALPRLYAYDAATGKELWKLDGVQRVPSPAKINARTYAFCTGGGFMRLVEPKSGKVLWSEKNNVSLSTVHGFVVADGRAFVPYVPGEAKTGPLAAFALSETGAKLLWQSKDTVERIYYAYRDGVIYVFNMPSDSVKTFKADDGTLLSDLSKSGYGLPHPWGDRVVLVGDAIHESLGHACYYQSCTPGPRDLKLSGNKLAPRTFKSYVGVGGYECVMRPPFADGFMFTRSVDTETGKGVILCWDLRAAQP